ncbi:RBBP8 N-terminal-like protein [Pelobates fuscus]|uniref:RBBP8 N-terminal-like protein n=1 Tax=Pelobates fuscus TaxID=191477 RepID=UPI002FE47676
MAADSFTEALHRLREIHDKDVLGMQAKLNELTVEKCRDAQRIDELFSKNHSLREQHKVLNENIKVLENRLRAGLCDRCKVTQELAKKKQQEFENVHYLTLQQISSLTNEMNSLKEENRTLLEELKTLKCLDNRNPRSYTPEANHSSDSPHSHVTVGNPKNGLEKTNKDEETQEKQADHPLPEEKGSAIPHLSPGEKTFQATSADFRLLEMCKPGTQRMNANAQNHQRISNQLHGTIAVLRSKGSQTAQAQAQTRRTSTSETHATGSGADFSEASAHLEALSQHLAQKCPGERGTGVPVEGTSRHLPSKNREAMLERDDWEEREAMVDLHDALVYMREHGYRGRMTHPNNRERLHYILSRQHQGLRSPQSPDDIQKSQRKERLDDGNLSLLQVLSARWKNIKHQDNQSKEQEWEDKEANYSEREYREHEETMPDKPLDLSDSKRGQHGNITDNKKEQRRMYESYIPSPTFSNTSSPPPWLSSSDLVHSGGNENTRAAAMNLETEHNRDSKVCSNQEDFQDGVMESKSSLDMDREAAGTKRSTRGQKRERESDPGQAVDKLADVPSPQEEDEDMSCSETETESSQNAVYVKEKIQDKARWTQKVTQASKKHLKKKKRGHNYSAESASSQQDGNLEKSNVFS